MRNLETLSFRRLFLSLSVTVLISCTDVNDSPSDLVDIPGDGPGLKCALTNPFSQEPECKQ